MIKIHVTAHSSADPTGVFALLKAGHTWPDWSDFTGFELERPGQGEAYGLGAIRVFKTAITTAREEIVELIPDRRLSYILLSGLPFTGYRADVDLAPATDGGTDIVWQSNFIANQKWLGWFWQRFMTWVLRNIATKMALAATQPKHLENAAKMAS
jgi:hypothetical protein